MTSESQKDYIDSGPVIDDDDALFEGLRGSVLAYEAPEEPVALNDWESLHEVSSFHRTG